MEMPWWWIPMCVVMGVGLIALFIHQIIRSYIDDDKNSTL